MPANCRISPESAGSVVLLARELLQIRGTYRYAHQVARDAAIAAFLERLDRELAEPLSLRCSIPDESSLFVEITVPRFSANDSATQWCELLRRTAMSAVYDARPCRLGTASLGGAR